MKLILLAPSDLPIPSVKGVAIETGIQQIIDENEKKHKIDIIVYSYYNQEAYEISKKYKHTRFFYYKANTLNKVEKIFIKGLNYILKKIKSNRRFNIHNLYLRFLIKNLKRYKNDVVLIKNATNYVIPISKKTNVKIYLQLHNDFLNHDTYKAEEIVNACEGLIANSEYIKKCILTIPNVNEEKVMINKNCLSSSDFLEITQEQKKEKAEEYHIDMNKRNILFAGRLVPQKGIKELLYAVEKISEEIDWNLVIVGSKWFGKNVKDNFTKELMAISQKNKEKIQFMGYVKHSDMRFLNAIVDVSVIPSIWEEPAGRVALEAQVVGTPIIISDSGGLPEYTNKKASIIVKRGETFIEDLEKALTKILSDENLKIKMGEEGKRLTIPYTSEHYYNEILEELNLI